MRWWTSDPHYNHFNIIRFTNRPFITVDEMNSALIQNHNNVVADNDEVFILGDIGFGSPNNILGIMNKLNGKKYLVFGNHDKPIRKKINSAFAGCFEWAGDYLEITQQDNTLDAGKQLIIMSHYPILSWNKAHHGSWMLHGHSHGSLNDLNESVLRHDVGVDCNNYFPLSYNDIKKIMSSKKQ